VWNRSAELTISRQSNYEQRVFVPLCLTVRNLQVLEKIGRAFRWMHVSGLLSSERWKSEGLPGPDLSCGRRRRF
jgi:hypothetical protein